MQKKANIKSGAGLRHVSQLRRLAKVRQWYRRNVVAPRPVAPLSDEAHVCLNCEQAFTGNFCPRCGQQAESAHVGVKFAMLRLLEVWGLNNFTMTSTIAQLFYRPGYLIADYLRGRRAGTFTPVKMLFILVGVYLLVDWVCDISHLTDLAGPVKAQGMDGTSKELVTSLERMTDWMDDHVAFMLLVSHFILAIFTKLFFRNSPGVGRMNFGQHCVAQVFIASQMVVFTMLYIAVTLGHDTDLIDFYDFDKPLTMLVYLIDYRQLFGRGWWSTFWRMSACVLLTLICLGFMVFAGMIILAAVMIATGNGHLV